MTAKTVEDLFLADDIRAIPGLDTRSTADEIDAATTHEEVEAIKARWRALFERLDENEGKVHDPFPTGNIAADFRVVCDVTARDFDEAETDEEIEWIGRSLLSSLKAIGAVPQ
jgi:hypothetical protein